jgi:hypothetical protein
MNVITGIIYLVGCVNCTAAIVLFSRWKIFNKKQTESFSLVFSACLFAALFCATKTAQSFLTSDGLTDAMDNLSEMLYILFVLNGVGVFIQMWRTRHRPDYKIEGIKPVILIMVLSLEFLVIIAFWSISYFYVQAKRVSIEQNTQYLYAMAEARAAHASSLVESYRESAVRYAQSARIAGCFDKSTGINNVCTAEEWKNTLSEIAVEDPNIVMMVTLDKDGKVIGAIDEKIVGSDWSQKDEYVNRNSSGYFSDIFSIKLGNALTRGLLGISATITAENEAVGTVIIYFKPDFIYNVLENNANLGDTGESYLVRSDGTLLSPRRFESQQFVDLSGRPDVQGCAEDFNTYVVETATGPVVETHDKILSVFNNEYGRSILGARAVMQGGVKNLRWCVVVEMGEQEGLSSLNAELVKAAVSAAIIVAGLMIIFIYVFDFIFRGDKH